jgi:IS5 family transposase
MKQQTLAGFERYGKATRRAQFLAQMERIVPWAELQAVVEPFYPKVSEAGGRPPIPLERMLRIYFLQLWFNLSDPAVEEALYDSAAMRSFAGIDLGQEAAPDETTVCKFRHLLERHKLGKSLLKTVNSYLARNGIKISNGTLVDGTIAKGKQWFFGMKAHVGVDSRHKLIHTILASAANISDSLALPHLLHGKETCVWGEQAYQGHTQAIRKVAPRARDLTNRRDRFGGRVDEAIKAKNRTKSKVRSKVEHAIGVIKRVFGFQKVRYRGLAKNLHRLKASAALANLFMMRRRLLTLRGRCA